ncbi:MAG: hypothetical protein WCG97_03625, partial [bacterium]
DNTDSGSFGGVNTDFGSFTPADNSSCSSCRSVGYSTPSYRYTTGSTPAYSYAAIPSYRYSNGSNSTPTNINSNTNRNDVISNSNPVVTNTNIAGGANVNVVVNVPSNGGSNNNTQTLEGSCSVNPSNNVQVGQDVSFSASASGGNGGYTYSWSGSDGLNSSSQSFTGRFYSSGSKYATVAITSNGQTISRSCNVNVGNNSTISAYCSATPSVANTNQYVTWTVFPTGGNSNYTYNWSGSDGLNGNNSSVSQQYYSTGQKNATVTVTSNGQSYTATCYSTINAIYGYQTQASNVTLIKGTSDQVGAVSGIYLNQVPATGISLSWKIALFAIGLLAWSAFAAFVVSRRKRTGLTANVSAASMIEAFKARNLSARNK